MQQIFKCKPITSDHIPYRDEYANLDAGKNTIIPLVF